MYVLGLKFEHYHDSRETCHNSDSITIVLNIIKSSDNCTVCVNIQYGTRCYIKELPKSKVGIIPQV